MDLMQGETSRDIYLITYFVVILTKTYTSLVLTLFLSIYDKTALISLENPFYGRGNNLSPYISFLALCNVCSVKSWCKRKDTITGNLFIVVDLSLMVCFSVWSTRMV